MSLCLLQAPTIDQEVFEKMFGPEDLLSQIARWIVVNIPHIPFIKVRIMLKMISFLFSSKFI